MLSSVDAMRLLLDKLRARHFDAYNAVAIEVLAILDNGDNGPDAESLRREILRDVFKIEAVEDNGEHI